MKEEEPMAKPPMTAVRPKWEELDEAVPPKIVCCESKILKPSEDKLAPLVVSAETKTGLIRTKTPQHDITAINFLTL